MIFHIYIKHVQYIHIKHAHADVYVQIHTYIHRMDVHMRLTNIAVCLQLYASLCYNSVYALVKTWVQNLFRTLI